MRQGWNDDDYLILFAPEEMAPAAAAYAIGHYLPGFTLAGIRGWDEFIVVGPDGSTLTIPTVPLDVRYAAALTLPEQISLEPDPRLDGKIKWYVKPLVFGGDASDQANMQWVTHEQHAGLVRWWNEQYALLKDQAP